MNSFEQFYIQLHARNEELVHEQNTGEIIHSSDSFTTSSDVAPSHDLDPHKPAISSYH
jgi:hypothetical protein